MSTKLHTDKNREEPAQLKREEIQVSGQACQRRDENDAERHSQNVLCSDTDRVPHGLTAGPAPSTGLKEQTCR